MLVKVTKLDIKRGDRLNPVRCPVARALRRALGYSRKVRVGFYTVKMFGKVELLPPPVIRFIEDFDSGAVVAPFSFRIKAPK